MASRFSVAIRSGPAVCGSLSSAVDSPTAVTPVRATWPAALERSWSERSWRPKTGSTSTGQSSGEERRLWADAKLAPAARSGLDPAPDRSPSAERAARAASIWAAPWRTWRAASSESTAEAAAQSTISPNTTPMTVRRRLRERRLTGVPALAPWGGGWVGPP